MTKMSKLKELIRELCPDGVEYKKVGNVADYEQPSKYLVKSTDYNDDFETPVLTAGQTFVLGYTNEIDGIYPASKESPVIIFDDFTAAFKWVDFPFKAKSSAMKMITAKGNVLIRYLYHLMGFLNYSSDEHKRLWLSLYSEFKIPVPPLPVQREIVRILDNFTALIAELTAELTARKKQYEFYRNKLLTFDDVRGGATSDVAWKTLGEVCYISAGGDAPKDSMSKQKTEKYSVPIISNGIGENALYGYTDAAKIEEPAVTVAARGTIGYAEYRDYPFYPIIRLLTAIPKDTTVVNTKYLYYCLQGKQYSVPMGGIPQLTAPELKKVEIPVPPLDVQSRIVNVLDNFDAICSDLKIGLPAEIEARKKQYEFYREKLLAFHEISN